MTLDRARLARAVGACVLVSVAGIVAFAAAGMGPAAPPAAAPPSGLSDLEACRPPAGLVNVDVNVVRDCLTGRLQALAARDGVQAADALAAGLEGQQYLQEACHDAGHAVGRSEYDSMPSLAAAASLGLRSCDGGFLHGLLDEAAVRNPGPEEKSAAIAACDAAPSDGWCADALGHLVWTTNPSFTAAVESCSTFRDDYKARSCMEGVFMRMIEPQHDARTPVLRTSALLAECRSEWTGSRPAVQEACATGVALAEQLFTVIPAVNRMRGQDSSLQPDVARDVFRTAMRACVKLPVEAWRGKCQIAVVWNTARMPALGDESAIVGCAQLPEELWSECADGQVDMAGPPVIPLERIREAAAAGTL